MHYPVGFLWKSESELLGKDKEPAIKAPATLEEWTAVLEKLTADEETPSPPDFAEALDRALVAMNSSNEPPVFIDGVIQFLRTKLVRTPSTHVKLKVLNVIIALLNGGVADEDEMDTPGLRCITLPTIFAAPEAPAAGEQELIGSGAERRGPPSLPRCCCRSCSPLSPLISIWRGSCRLLQSV